MTYCDITLSLEEGQFPFKAVCKKIIKICLMHLEIWYFEQHSVKTFKNLENKFGPQRVKTPTYSPDFNPAEFVFNKMRSVMCYELWELTNKNI